MKKTNSSRVMAEAEYYLTWNIYQEPKLYLFTEPIVVILVNQREMAEHYPEVSVYH
jgi:hypothetical protein